MKKRFKFVLMTMMLVIVLSLTAVPALAASMDGEDVAPPEFFTLAWLGTLAGVVAAVAVMVQICKFLMPINLDPKIYCLIWSAIFTMARLLWVAPPQVPADWFAGIINLFIVAVAATGTFEFAIKPIQRALLKAPGSNTNVGGSDDAQ